MSKVTVLAVLATVAVLLAVASADRPGARHFIEKDVRKVPNQWIAMPGVNPSNKMFPLNIAIKQRNLDKLSRIFESVTNPESPNYAKYLEIDQITAITEPAEESIEAVVQWLAAHGVTEYTLTKNRDFIYADVPLATVSRMLDVQFTTYIHRRSGKMATLSTEAYSAPASVAQHIDFVLGFNAFPAEPRKSLINPKPATDGFQVGPHELRQRYNVTQILAAHPNNKQAVAEFQGEFYSASDLQQFMKKYYPSNNNPSWWTAKVDGTNDPTNPSTEGSLDIQYIMGVAPGIPTTFYSRTSMDFYSSVMKWATEISTNPNAEWVHSISYGSQGNYPTKAVQDRFSTEMQKIGLRGISIIFASGDSGVGCFLCENQDPSWPATSPYVTAVGATHFLQYGVGPEGATDPWFQFGSGGGLSWYDAIPSYQKNQVDGYFAIAQNLPATSMYNRNGRATPDVAALGMGYTVLQSNQGGWVSVGGTSASAPTFAAIISMLNNDRLNAGKPTLGFLNPWIYQTASKVPGAFWDVTVGSNPYSCCTTGFTCATGYDPVTGVGTPNFNKLRTALP